MLNKPGYSWRVIHDPTRTGEDPGLFFGGHFRSIDIELPKSLGHSKLEKITGKGSYRLCFVSVQAIQPILNLNGY